MKIEHAQILKEALRELNVGNSTQALSALQTLQLMLNEAENAPPQLQETVESLILKIESPDLYEIYKADKRENNQAMTFMHRHKMATREQPTLARLQDDAPSTNNTLDKLRRSIC